MCNLVVDVVNCTLGYFSSNRRRLVAAWKGPFGVDGMLMQSPSRGGKACQLPERRLAQAWLARLQSSRHFTAATGGPGFAALIRCGTHSGQWGGRSLQASPSAHRPVSPSVPDSPTRHHKLSLEFQYTRCNLQPSPKISQPTDQPTNNTRFLPTSSSLRFCRILAPETGIQS
jgi:hypothetical protein